MHLDLADYLVIGAFVIALVGLVSWVVTYAVTTRGDWRLTREGRHLMAFRTSLALFMAMGIANNVWLSYPGRDLIRVTIVSLFAVSVLDGLRVLLIAQAHRRGQRRVHRVVQLHTTVPEEGGTGEHPAGDVLKP